MDNMTSLIEAAIKSGKSPEDIAKEFANALNAAEQKQKKKEVTGEDILIGYLDAFDEAFEDDEVTVEDLAGYILAYLWENNDNSTMDSWHEDELECAKKGLMAVLNEASEMFESTRKLCTELEKMFDAPPKKPQIENPTDVLMKFFSEHGL